MTGGAGGPVKPEHQVLQGIPSPKCYPEYRPPSVTENTVPHKQELLIHNPNLKIKITAGKGMSLLRDKYSPLFNTPQSMRQYLKVPSIASPFSSHCGHSK